MPRWYTVGGMAMRADQESSGPERVMGEAVEALEDVGEFSARLAQGTVLGVLAYLGEIVRMLWQALRALRYGLHTGDLLRQMRAIGVESLPIALLTVGFSGAVLALYTAKSLTDYGAGGLIGGIVALSIVKETGPLITGVALVARAGSGMTAEIGSMKATEQIDALRAMAISPIEYLVVPRLLACLVMLPVVTLFADAAGMLGGGLVAVNEGQSSQAFIDSFRLMLEPDGSDVGEGLIKSVVFGAIIAAIACREGLAAEGGAVGVGRATNRSVVLSIILIFAADFVLTWLFKVSRG